MESMWVFVLGWLCCLPLVYLTARLVCLASLHARRDFMRRNLTNYPQEYGYDGEDEVGKK